MKVLEKEFQRLQKQSMWFVKNNIDSYSIDRKLIMFINIRVLRLRSRAWKSSLTKD